MEHLHGGREVDVRVLDQARSPAEPAACAAYIAKYTTKSTEHVGGLLRRLS